jgi:hypothetical protein
MSMTLQEVYDKLGDLLKQGIFEYTPTDIEDVVRRGPCFIGFEGGSSRAEVSKLTIRLEHAEREAESAEWECERLRDRLVDAGREIAKLKEQKQ